MTRAADTAPGTVAAPEQPEQPGLAERALNWLHWRAERCAHFVLMKIPSRMGNLRQYPACDVVPDTRFCDAGGKALPSIAVVTPAFNQGQFIEATVRSVMGQGYPRLSYAVRDGGSTDDTPDVLARLGAELGFRWISEKDRGQADAINKGFEMVDGEIMAWINSDDVLMPGALADVGAYFAANPEVDVVYGHRILIDEAGREIGRWVMPPYRSEAITFFDYIPQETLFWRRSAWEKAGGRVDVDFQFALDWDLLLRFRDSGAQIVRLPRFLGCFRIHEAQKTSAQIGDVGVEEMKRLKPDLSVDGRLRRRMRRTYYTEQFRAQLTALMMRAGYRSEFA